ncbi:hypothetical protein QT384_11205 (plasmid) [Arcobacter cryaerophilus gv. pseudocryaerophilus]|uniref:Uncharacterized protein n=3 Tax=Arcobacteraceae TaxID=2808963 RepID=A0AA96DXP5_9BACT|nr:hypothetical protein RMP68_11205 [Arcobacter sp. AZ-2023]WNL37297.1 hypothetical protein RMQ66_11205 [Arcobacter sp. AZ-2023]WPD13013.1 hypothetical protein QT384_11205 [Arcobacter sp. DSM 115960]
MLIDNEIIGSVLPINVFKSSPFLKSQTLIFSSLLAETIYLPSELILVDNIGFDTPVRVLTHSSLLKSHILIVLSLLAETIYLPSKLIPNAFTLAK